MAKKKITKKQSSRKTNAKLKIDSQNSKKHNKKAKGLSAFFSNDIWPIERDLLIRPDRFRYVRKMVKDDGCVFCKAADGHIGAETLKVYETQSSMIVLNKYPYNSGHILVLPKRHCGSLLKLTDDEYLDLQLTQRKAVAAVSEVYQPTGLNMGMNHGAVAGAGIPDHLHYHVIPRWAGDVNFFPLIAETKVVIETLEQSFERLLSYFSKLK
jgi:ATP adenylyltransferase